MVADHAHAFEKVSAENILLLDVQENPLPFPSGASVEILVRTHELKLRLRGVVQAAHPGFGMGVSFELKTKDECESVKKLTDFVAATTEPSN